MISFLNPPNDNISISVGNTSRNSNNSSRSNSSVNIKQIPNSSSDISSNTSIGVVATVSAYDKVCKNVSD
jgi:hypothetical protein